MFLDVAESNARNGAAARARIQRYLAPSLQELPFWARLISAVFTVLSGALGLTIAFVALAVADHVIQYQAFDSVPMIAALGGTALLLALVLNMARHLALAAAPAHHQVLSNKIELIMVAGVLVALGAIHPAMVAGVVAMAIVLAIAVLVEGRLESPDVGMLGPVEVRHLMAGREPSSIVEELKPKQGRLLVFEPLVQFAGALAGLLALLVGGWLAADKFITIGGMIAAVFISAWCGAPMAEYARRRVQLRRAQRQITDATDEEEAEAAAGDKEAAAEEEEYALPTLLGVEDEDEAFAGLRVEGLTVRDKRIQGKRKKNIILGPIDLTIEAGSAIGVTGPPGAGKSLLLKSVVCQHPHKDLLVTGESRLKGWPIWGGSDWFDAVSIVHVPQRPILLAGSAMENLLCFDVPPEEDIAARVAKGALAKLNVFGPEAEQLLAEQDVMRLSEAQAQTLSLARALMLNPDLLILDMPDAGLPANMHPALADAIHVAQRGGTAVLVATANRLLLEKCDEVLMLRDGYIADRGLPTDLLKRHGTSWSRLVIKRSLEEERRLHAWLRSHFRRTHDASSFGEAKAMATNFLTLSNADVEDEEAEDDLATFDFRWGNGCFYLTMHDDGDPITQAKLRALEEGRLGNAPEDVALRDLRDKSENFEVLPPDTEQDLRRVICVTLAAGDGRSAIPDGRQG